MQLKDAGLTFEDIKNYTDTYMIETYQRFPFLAAKAKGMYIYDQDGNKHLDFYGGVAVNSAGSCNDKVVEAILDQAPQLMHVFNYPYSIPQAVLAKLICESLDMEKIFFQNSGTEANEAMIKLARKYGTDNFGENKYHIITAKRSFHGRTYGSMSATGQPDNACQVGFKPMVPGFSYAEFNNLDDFAAKVTDDTIAIMLESIQAEGGVYPATQEFMDGIQKLCKEKGLLLLVDEIQTGWYRTGAVMGYSYYGIKPDMVSIAKAMVGGMPIGAMCTSKKIAAAYNMGAHGTTYGGNPVACAASLAAIKELQDKKLGENAAEVGNYFMSKLKGLPFATEVRGRGLLVAVEFEKPIAAQIKHNALDRRLLTTAIGTSIIRMVPPLIASKKDCDTAVDILRESIEAI